MVFLVKYYFYIYYFLFRVFHIISLIYVLNNTKILKYIKRRNNQEHQEHLEQTPEKAFIYGGFRCSWCCSWLFLLPRTFAEKSMLNIFPPRTPRTLPRTPRTLTRRPILHTIPVYKYLCTTFCFHIFDTIKGRFLQFLTTNRTADFHIFGVNVGFLLQSFQLILKQSLYIHHTSPCFLCADLSGSNPSGYLAFNLSTFICRISSRFQPQESHIIAMYQQTSPNSFFR